MGAPGRYPARQVRLALEAAVVASIFSVVVVVACKLAQDGEDEN